MCSLECLPSDTCYLLLPSSSVSSYALSIYIFCEQMEASSALNMLRISYGRPDVFCKYVNTASFMVIRQNYTNLQQKL